MSHFSYFLAYRGSASVSGPRLPPNCKDKIRIEIQITDLDSISDISLLHLEHVPVEDVVIGEALAVEQVAKQLPQIAEK